MLKQITNAISVSIRTLKNYEGGASYPQDRSVYFRLAEFFKMDVNYFLTEDEEYLALVGEN